MGDKGGKGEGKGAKGKGDQIAIAGPPEDAFDAFGK